MKKYALTFILLLASVLLKASEQYIISQTALERHLDGQSINALAKDHYGRLWVGTDLGVSIISNGIVKTLTEAYTDHGRIVLSEVSDIICTDHALIASGSCIIDMKGDNGQASVLSYAGKPIDAEIIAEIGQLAVIFDKTSMSLYAYDMEEKQCKILRKFDKNGGFSFSAILSRKDSCDKMEVLLIDRTKGVFRFDMGTGMMERIDKIVHPYPVDIADIDNSEGIIWLASSDHGVIGYNMNEGYAKIEEYTCFDNAISSIKILPKGNLLVCCRRSGIYIINRNMFGLNRIVKIDNGNVRNVSSILINPIKDEILLGTLDYGLVSMKKSFIGAIRKLNAVYDKLSPFNIAVSAFEEPDGSIIIATGNDGIMWMDIKNKKIKLFHKTVGENIVSMCRYDRNRIIYCVKNKGLYILDLENEHISAFMAYEEGFEESDGYSNTILTSLPDGNIMILNFNGNHYLYNITEDFFYPIELQTDGRPITEKVDKCCVLMSSVFIAVRGSVMEIDCESFQVKQVLNIADFTVNSILCIDVDSQGKIWLVEPAGLHCYDPESSENSMVLSSEGIGCFLNISVDHQDRIWIPTSSGYILLYERADKAPTLFSSENGVPDCHFLSRFSLLTKDGYVLFPISNGLVNVDTGRLPETEQTSLTMACLSAESSDKRFSHDELASSDNTPLKLPVGSSWIAVDVTVNSFNPSYNHLLRYSLTRNGKPFSSVTSYGSELRFEGLKAGSYKLTANQMYTNEPGTETTLLYFKIPQKFCLTFPGIITVFLVAFIVVYPITALNSTLKKLTLEKKMAEIYIKNRDNKINFLSSIAHELRSSLFLIYIPIKETLQKKDLSSNNLRKVESLHNQINKMNSMINLILDSSHNIIDKEDLLFEMVNLNEWLGTIILNYEIICKTGQHNLRFIPDYNVNEVNIDKNIVETCLSNLINNAVKYSPPGSSITIYTTKKEGFVNISVKDRGRGFKCDAEDLFKRNFREQPDDGASGYGLGLTYVRMLMELSGGTITASSNPDGIGSIFRMSLPI